MVDQRVSPAEFARMREALLRSENAGLHPDECARRALDSIGLPHQPTNFIVDYSVNSQ